PAHAGVRSAEGGARDVRGSSSAQAYLERPLVLRPSHRQATGRGEDPDHVGFGPVRRRVCGRSVAARPDDRRRGAKTRSNATTRPSVVCGSATACTMSPQARASAAVTGPMHTTLGKPRTAPTAPTNPRTVEALVNVT